MLMNNSWLLLAIIAVFAVFVQSDYQQGNSGPEVQNLISNGESNVKKTVRAETTGTKENTGKGKKNTGNGQTKKSQ
ncbi:unnamed protein product [Schistosoma curassoni]|nr:unnamed protein product [Schistosoma curassoni]